MSPSLGFPARSDTNRPVQSQKKALDLTRGLIVLCCSENKGTADQQLCFGIG